MAETGQAPKEGDLFVAPKGDDDFSGKRPDRTDDGSEGPFKTIERAIAALREASTDDDVTVWLRGGRYRIREPICLTPGDGPVTLAAYPDEEPVIDGGRRINGFEETTVNGVEAWKTTLDAVADGEWFFRQLFVDGERRPRARLPSQGWFEVADPDPVPEEHRRTGFNAVGEHGRSFRVDAGDVAGEGFDSPVGDWEDPELVDAVIPKRWLQERSPLARTEPESDRVELELYPSNTLDGGERVAFEHVREALSEPGEWYLDGDRGDLFYIPRSGETIGDVDVFAPVIDQLLKFDGDPANEPVSDIKIRGLTFRHADWDYPGRHPEYWEPRKDEQVYDMDGAASSIQAELHVPGAISFRGARECEIVECTLERVGFYGIRIGPGSRWNRVVDNDLRDVGAGGVKVTGVLESGPEAEQTGHNTITDNHIHALGRVFPAGVGVLVAHGFDNDVSYNHIHDLYYTGISTGWSWTFDRQVARDNRIAYNHIHDVGQGLLSDMGGIYTIGLQPGTVIRGNRIHDVEKYDYGGWGIYLDGGSSHIVVADNVVYDTGNQSFNQHWGRGNDVRRNVLAFGGDGGFRLTRTAYNQEHRMEYEDWHLTADAVPHSLVFERNVVVTDNNPAIVGGYGWDLDPTDLESDLNWFWDTKRDAPFCKTTDGDEVLLEQWQERGPDGHSVVAEPGFEDLQDRAFAVDADLAATLGGQPVTPADVGPREE